MLIFSSSNTKTDLIASRLKLKSSEVRIFDLPAGKTCPGALQCKAWINRKNGHSRLQEGPNCQFRCYAASQEAFYQNVYLMRKRNLSALLYKSEKELVNILQYKLPVKAKIIRLHASGDFFSYRYFRSWMKVIQQNPDITFYAYTKSIHFVKQYLKSGQKIPKNLLLTLSYGSKYDKLISEQKKTGMFRTSRVVFSHKEAKKYQLKIDMEDKYPLIPKKKDFALLVHGVQKGINNGN